MTIKKTKKNYSGKKKRHTICKGVVTTPLLVINLKTGLIICIVIDSGCKHDFSIFKESKLPIPENILVLGDKGYQGIKKYHPNSDIPHKKHKNKKLTAEQKQENKRLAKQRIIIEHINRKLKIFKILSLRYRNRKKSFGLRVNLISGIYLKQK